MTLAHFLIGWCAISIASAVAWSLLRWTVNNFLNWVDKIPVQDC